MPIYRKVPSRPQGARNRQTATIGECRSWRHVGWQSRRRTDQGAAWLARIAADHIECVATIGHGRCRYVEGVAGVVVRPL